MKWGRLFFLVLPFNYVVWYSSSCSGNILGATELRGPVSYSFKDLKIATKDFNESNKLGEGGFGDVYKVCNTKTVDDPYFGHIDYLGFSMYFLWDSNVIEQGTLKNGNVVAVKKLAIMSSRAKADFETEVRLISNVHHRNLIRLLGCSNKGSDLLLVYEYMANGSLDRYLYGRSFCLSSLLFSPSQMKKKLNSSYLSWFCRWQTRDAQLEATIQYYLWHSSWPCIPAWTIPRLHHPSRYKIQQHSVRRWISTKNCWFWTCKTFTWGSKPC